jgi:poly(ADP-ribose) glycohydrolase ARH3
MSDRADRAQGRADRWRGALLGTALGDGIGAPFEGHRHVEVDEVERWLAAADELIWTDDTAMTIALARSLLARGGTVDEQHLGDGFAASFHAEPWRGYGSGPPRIFAAAARGTPYVDAAAALFDGRGSFGNGAAMRATPAAIVGGNDLTRVADLARAQARVTHAHPLGTDGAALLALGVAALATFAGPPAAAIELTLPHLETDELRRAAATAVELGPTATPRTIAGRLGNGIAALEAVPAALAAFLASPDDPRAVYVRAVATGGDTDTIAAMAGALVGANVGARGLPADLLSRLEGRAEIGELADRLAAVAHHHGDDRG